MIKKCQERFVQTTSLRKLSSCLTGVGNSPNQLLYNPVPRPWHKSLSPVCRTSSLLHNPILKKFSSSTKTRKMSLFKFSDYDCVGFDLDNTLLRYNVKNMAKLEYEVLAKFMVEKRAYNREFLYKPLRDEDIDFMQKGLILDFDRGNVVRISSDGTIKRVSHGTKLLTDEEISKFYPNRRWDATDAFVNDTLETWNGPMSLKMRSLLDYFDMPSSLAFARAVDSVDDEKSTPPATYAIWPDVLDGLIDMFDGKNFRTDAGEYFPSLKKNPDQYLRKCTPETVAWLRELKRKKVTFLITGSNADFADFTASYALGEDWKSLFDVVVCFARKPGFFTGDRAFVTMAEYDEDETVTGAQLKRGELYSQGNWRELNELLSKICKNDSPKCVYVGDNLIQDIYVPRAHANCDTVVISEELQSEGINVASPHPDAKTLNSAYWGSYYSIKDSENSINSFWCHLIENYSKICVPTMDTIARKSIDEPYECFDKTDKTHSHGFHPSKPQSL